MDTQDLLNETARSGHLVAWVLAALPALVTGAWVLFERTTRGPSLAALLLGVARTLVF